MGLSLLMCALTCVTINVWTSHIPVSILMTDAELHTKEKAKMHDVYERSIIHSEKPIVSSTSLFRMNKKCYQLKYRTKVHVTSRLLVLSTTQLVTI